MRPGSVDTVHNVESMITRTGPALWEDLHTCEEPNEDWLLVWESRIPCNQCRAWYFAWKLANPPRLNDWFAWSIELHNAVNAKLERAVWTIEQARERWPMIAKSVS